MFSAIAFMTEINDFLKEGPLTGRSPLIEEKVKQIIKIPGDNLGTAIQIIDWIARNFKPCPVYKGQYTSEQLYSMMMMSDYLDLSVIFTVAARAKEIPTKCVEAVSKDILGKWKGEPTTDMPRHYFVEIYNRREWVVVGLPHKAFISGPESYLLYGKLHHPTGIGLDYMDIINRGPIEDRIKQILSPQ